MTIGLVYEPGDGRTVTELSDYLANNAVFNPKDFGAIGDGTSHPLSEFYLTLEAAQENYPNAKALHEEIDWVASQKAMNVVGARGGGTVYFPAGTYMGQGGPLLPSSGSTIMMDAAAVLVQQTEEQAVIRALNTTGVEFLGCNVQHATRATRRTCGAIEVFGSSQFAVLRCNVRNSSGLGIQIGNSSDGRIAENYVTNTLADGVHVMNGGNANMVSRRISIVGNVTRDTGDDGIAVISYSANGQLVCEHIAIVGNVVSRSLARGITVGGGRFVSIVGNSISENIGSCAINILQDAVFTTHNVDYVSVVGNTVSPGLAAVDVNNHGIRVWKARRCVVAHNMCSFQTGTEIRVYGEVGQRAEDVLVDGNTVCGSSTSGEKGIWLTRTDRCAVVRNTVVDSYKEGIYADDSDWLTCDDNQIVEANRSGLSTRNLLTVAGSKHVRARRNRFVQSTARFQHVVALSTLTGQNDTSDSDVAEVNAALMSGALLDLYSTTIKSGYSADRGNAHVTLTAADARLQLFLTALTADRSITLPTTGVPIGDTFEIMRTGLGAGTLDVGGLKTIPASTAAVVRVMRTGSGWMLTGYQTL